MKDETIFALRSPGQGALEAHTLTNSQTKLTEAQWIAQRNSLASQGEAVFCMSSDSFGDWKADIEKLCSFHPEECGYSTTNAGPSFLGQIFAKLENLKSKVLK